MQEVTHPYLDLPPGKARTLANAVSNVINPVFVGVFVVGLLVFRSLGNRAEATKWLSVTTLITSVPPILYVVYLVKTGYLIDIYMPERERRIKPLLVTFLWLIISLLILHQVHAPRDIILLINAVLVQLVLLSLVTMVWKISFHSASIMSAATITILLHSDLTWVLAPLVPLVGWARVYLQRHTLMQVIGGYVAGSIIAVMAYLVISQYLNF